MLFDQGEGGAHDLVHVVVTIFGKTADEMYIGLRHSQCRIALEKCFIVRPGYRVIRIAIGHRIFPDHGSSHMFLPGQMFKFRDPGVGVIVRIVNRTHRLIAVHVRQMLVLETQTAVW